MNRTLQEYISLHFEVKELEDLQKKMIPFFKEMIHVNSKQGFENMNTELKTRVEALKNLNSK